jgi:hypothetical protein
MRPNDVERPPLEAGALARWFAEGVRSELAALEKDGGARNYELLSGKLVEVTGPTEAIFHFIVADGTRIPEEATGSLRTASDEYAASVIGQQANRIHIHVEGNRPPPPGIPQGILVIDDTALLRRLAEILEETAANPTVGPLATTVFHPGQAKVGFADLPTTPVLAKITGEVRRVLEQACGSSLTYIWGPPGTGKTYALAHLVTALIEAGERVLVTSHTHAAVDQALYEAVKSEGDKPGPLARHLAVRDGNVLRIGLTADRKVPDSVRLDKVMESRARKLESMISELEAQARPLAERRATCHASISDWDKLAELTNRLQAARHGVEEGDAKRIRAQAAAGRATALLQQRRADLQRAQRAWLWRGAKTQRATQALGEAEGKLRGAERVLAFGLQEMEKAGRLVDESEAAFISQRTVCEALPTRELIQRELSATGLELGPLEENVRALQDELSQLEHKLIADAQAIFCTLTKNYKGKELSGQAFDAVIVDEISMALPPLVFLAAGRATSRVVLVGDFLQLPPIVRSDAKISNERLGTDTFHLAGVAREMKPASGCAVLTRLTTQQRMAPAIADVARHLVYRRAGLDLWDAPSVLDRKAPNWLDFLPANPLVILDTADLHCWSGKQPGSLSRFNFYSGTVAVELAAMAAVNLPEPPEDQSQPVGIVTPFAAQRSLLSKLVKDMGLERWVAAGTVHTFQGGQAELVIFDSVLDEPYWSARLCTPGSAPDVLRELNVAATRAKNKFVLVGSSEWLNKHAKPPSGLGQMWALFRDRADLVSAAEVVEVGFAHRVADHSLDAGGWRLPYATDGPVHEILDETGFFERFASDVALASKSIFGLVPYFGEYRWPRVQPLLTAALARGVEVTLVTPPLSEAENRAYVESAIKNLRNLGAVVVQASGLHGKDIIIDERIHYTGSLNWASHRGRSEIMHRTDSPALARLVLQFMQARYIRGAAIHEDGGPRACPDCGGPTQVVNQLQQRGPWDFQALKIGCASYQRSGCKYLRDVDERPPFLDPPRCQVDGRTKYRRVRRGRGEVWQCPKHPRECATRKVVPGDPA